MADAETSGGGEERSWNDGITVEVAHGAGDAGAATSGEMARAGCGTSGDGVPAAVAISSMGIPGHSWASLGIPGHSWAFLGIPICACELTRAPPKDGEEDGAEADTEASITRSLSLQEVPFWMPAFVADCSSEEGDSAVACVAGE